ncbi:hypothetical protein CCACVL1_21093 [Corchorus capsularis]|uniref:Uncharacterized protein n=1 Tax=Corchorus capsularis TaxID=210143 RepID=A0A1R3H884_COCAP|nr:hypothetical protein CCACVL1_21093 [Corchorus capsularis]
MAKLWTPRDGKDWAQPKPKLTVFFSSSPRCKKK